MTCGSCGLTLNECFETQCQWGVSDKAYWHDEVGEELHFPCVKGCPACEYVVTKRRIRQWVTRAL